MREWPTLIGEKFGMLTVIEQAPSSAKGLRRWLCRCDCGTEKIVTGSNLRRGTTVSCGCKHKNDLTGRRIGRLTVIGLSDRYGSRGNRQTQLWECRCDCGGTTYKATDTLTNPDISMCRACAAEYGITQARTNLGYGGGTQITKIRNCSAASKNASGVRGAYLDRKTGKYRARLKFKGTLYDLGSFTRLEDAVKARRRGEEEFFDPFLAEAGKLR